MHFLQGTLTHKRRRSRKPFMGPEPRSPEEEIIAAQEAEEEARQLAGWREQVLSSLDGDYDAQMMVEGMLDGQRGAALQALVDLPDKEFASKQRKVRRCIEKLKAEAPNRRGRP